MPFRRTQIRHEMREIDEKFRQYRRQWSQYLSPANIRERKQYASNYGFFNSEQKANVLYPDECSM